jgi:hypothetical protein
MSRQILVAIFIVTGGAVTSSAQTMTAANFGAARAGVRLGYGGRGIDWETSIDSPLLAGIGRFRADVGLGRWVGIGEVPPPVGDAPWITRVAGTAILFMPLADLPPDVRPYIGLGVAGYVPVGVEMTRQRGTRVILGLERSGDQWDVGPEVEFDLPTERAYQAGTSLIPAVRIGVALRRRF